MPAPYGNISDLTLKLLTKWIGDNEESRPLFPSLRGELLSRDALEHLVRKHSLTASRTCPSIGTNPTIRRKERGDDGGSDRLRTTSLAIPNRSAKPSTVDS